MDTVEQVSECTRCRPGRTPTRLTPLPITVQVEQNAVSGLWEIKKDPITLDHYFDEVSWCLKNLIAYFTLGTTFEIRFLTGPFSFDDKRGPFDSIVRVGDRLVGTPCNGPLGCYTYNLLVIFPGGASESLPIDPQIDHAAPPIDMYKNPDPEDDYRGQEY